MALSSVTWKEIEWQVRYMTGATDATNPTSTVMMRWGNMIQDKIMRLLSGIAKPWGRETSTLSLLNETGIYIGTSTGATYTASTKTIAKTALGLSQSYVGGWAFFGSAVGSPYYGLIDWVATDGASCKLRFANGYSTAPDISSTYFRGFLKPNPVFWYGANISSLSILDIIKLVDGTNGNVVRKDHPEFAHGQDNPTLTNNVYCEYAGDAIYTNKGSGVSSYGTLTLTFDKKPDTISSATSTIDLLPEHLQMFVEELARWTLNYKNSPIPKNLENPLQMLEAAYKKNAEYLATKIANRGIPAKRGQ